MSFLGMDVAGTRRLASEVGGWSSQVDSIVGLVQEAESLCELSTGAIGPLLDIGSSGVAMASALRSAADQIEGFAISVHSPSSLMSAVAAVQGFRGSDNDPELDRRLAVLTGLVEAEIDNPVEAAEIVQHLLAADPQSDPGDMRYGDVGAVEAARAELARLSKMAAEGAISDNDSRLDDAYRDLKAAIGAHTGDPGVQAGLLARLVSAGDEAVDTRVVMTAGLTGHDDATVMLAHSNGLDYEIAAGVVKLARVDEISARMSTVGSPHEVDRLSRQRIELLEELAGTTDPAVLGSLLEQISAGTSAAGAFAIVEAEIIEEQRLAVVADALGISVDEAVDRLAEMDADVAALTATGVSAEDAAAVVEFAEVAGVDLAEIEAVADAEQIGLVEAANRFSAARAYGMSVEELAAYEAFTTHFDTFDTATGDAADGTVSVNDLNHVLNNPDQFSEDQVAAALAIIRSSTLRYRLDSARDNNQVIGHDVFGDTAPGDHKISRDDLAAFELKQAINTIIKPHLDPIDTVNGGDIDHTRRKHDFQTYLDNNRAVLTSQEISAIEHVIAADWHDQTWWERNSDSVILAAAVIAGTVATVATAGTAAPIATALVAGTAAGAATAATITISANTLTGETWHHDLAHNTALGATGGLAGAGLTTGAAAWGTGSLGSQTINALGLTAETATLVSLGIADPALEHIYTDAEIDRIKQTNTHIALATGATALAGSVALGRLTPTQLTNHGTRPPTNPQTTETGSIRALDDVLPTPSVTDPKLRNHVDNLYKGTTNPNRVGTGTTADAVRNELTTGLPTGGTFHLTKAQETVRGLTRWLRNNLDASYSDRLVAQSLLDDLVDALGATP